MMILCRTISNLSSTRSKLGREDIKWSELLSHFRAVQNRHEKARRQGLGAESTPVPEPSHTVEQPPPNAVNGTTSIRPPMRRRLTGNEANAIPRPPSRALSPLNPRARVQGSLTSSFAAQSQTSPPAHSQALQRQQQQQQQKRVASVNRGPAK